MDYKMQDVRPQPGSEQQAKQVNNGLGKGRGKKILLWSLVVFGGLAILGGLYLALTNLKQIHLYLTPVAISKGTIRTQVVFPGTVDFTNHVVLQFQQVPASGVMISWVGVKVGDHVSKNQLLASLDQQSVFKQQQANLATYWKQRLTYDQTVNNNNNLTPQTALNDSQKRLLQQNQVDLDQSVFTVELQDIVQRLSNLWSPIDGIVTRVDTPVAGVNIQTADEARFEVINPQTMFFSANIDESEVSNLHVGDKGIVILNAYPATYLQATITDIAFASHQDSNGNTVYTVKLQLDGQSNNNYAYKLGMGGNVIFYEYGDNILTIPNEYIHQDDNGSYVRLGKDKKLTYIQIGITNGKATEVVKGLVAGEEVYY